MTKQQFKETYIANLRTYLPEQHRDVKIIMRIAKKGEQCYYDNDISSVRTVTHAGNKWRVEIRESIWGISEMMSFAHYKTADVSWDYKGKNK